MSTDDLGVYRQKTTSISLRDDVSTPIDDGQQTTTTITTTPTPVHATQNSNASNISTPTGQTTDIINNNTQPSYCSLFTNQLFYSRILILLITIFLFVLSLCYTFGQILSLELSDFWCEKRSIQEVRENSILVGNNRGVGNGCWRSKLNTVNHFFSNYIQLKSMLTIHFMIR